MEKNIEISFRRESEDSSQESEDSDKELRSPKAKEESFENKSLNSESSGKPIPDHLKDPKPIKLDCPCPGFTRYKYFPGMNLKKN